MIESWFFADPGALSGVTLNQTPRLVPGNDPEAFATADETYAQDDGSACQPWQHLEGRKRKLHRPPWMGDDRTRHPKAYLSWLMKDPAQKGCSRYRETVEGARVLGRLDWQGTLKTAGHCSYLRAMIEDLSIALDVPLPWLVDAEVAAPTRYRRTSSVLRNI